MSEISNLEKAAKALCEADGHDAATTLDQRGYDGRMRAMEYGRKVCAVLLAIEPDAAMAGAFFGPYIICKDNGDGDIEGIKAGLRAVFQHIAEGK